MQDGCSKHFSHLNVTEMIKETSESANIDDTKNLKGAPVWMFETEIPPYPITGDLKLQLTSGNENMDSLDRYFQNYGADVTFYKITDGRLIFAFPTDLKRNHQGCDMLYKP